LSLSRYGFNVLSVKSSISVRMCFTSSGSLTRAASAGTASTRTACSPLQLVGQRHGVLRVHVVVDQAVDEQQLAAQVLRGLTTEVRS